MVKGLPATEDVRLSLYDVSTMNTITYPFGWGKFHSGVEVYGNEYIYTKEGIYDISPQSGAERSAGKYKFRRSIALGKTALNKKEVSDLIDGLQPDFSTSLYDPISNNSNHFANTVSKKLCGRAIPQSVNLVSDLAAFSLFYPVFKVVKPS